jgi:hypothetical protein
MDFQFYMFDKSAHEIIRSGFDVANFHSGNPPGEDASLIWGDRHEEFIRDIRQNCRSSGIVLESTSGCSGQGQH